MEIEKKSKRCSVKHTPICKFLGCDGCEKCSLHSKDIKEEDKQKTNEIWKITQTNLPIYVDIFHDADVCFFCKKKPRNPKVGYAQVEMAHPEPAYEKGMIFGLGSLQRAEVGSLIPFPIAICKECKKKYNLAENLKFYSAGVGLVLGLLTVGLCKDTDFIKYSPIYIPMVLMLFVMALTYGIGKWLSGKIIEKYKKEMYFNVFDIPELKEMEEMGWFVYRNEADKTRLVMTKKKPRENFQYFSDDIRQPDDKD